MKYLLVLFFTVLLSVIISAADTHHQPSVPTEPNPDTTGLSHGDKPLFQSAVTRKIVNYPPQGGIAQDDRGF